MLCFLLDKCLIVAYTLKLDICLMDFLMKQNGRIWNCRKKRGEYHKKNTRCRAGTDDGDLGFRAASFQNGD